MLATGTFIFMHSSSQFRYVPSAKFNSGVTGTHISDELKWQLLERRPKNVYDYNVRPEHHRAAEEMGDFDGRTRESDDQSTSETNRPAETGASSAAEGSEEEVFIPGGGYAKHVFEKW